MTGVLLGQLSAEGWVLIITAAGLLLTKLYTMRDDSQKEKAKLKREEELADRVEKVRLDAIAAATKVEKKVDEVATAATAKQDEDLVIGRATHQLVNKETSLQLQKIVDLNRIILELSSPEYKPEAAMALERSEADLEDHLKRQAEVDRKYGQAAAKDMGTNRTGNAEAKGGGV
jgi:hypothetical protein